jgi:pimeloyl-ACP methyl ester carboxylesterase
VSALAVRDERLTIAGTRVRVQSAGDGPPLLYLHGAGGVSWLPGHAALAERCRLIVPEHPNWGEAELADGLESIDDLVYFYLDFLDALGLEHVHLAGHSLGGWLAAEIAVACSHRLEKLVLVDALGIKVSDRETPDILDVFNTHPDEVRRRSWHDPARFAPDPDAMTDEALVVRARNWDSLCLYGWQPYMYNPRLSRWLSRIAVPTLVLWGASDGIVKPSYGEAYAALIPGARFQPIAEAGHHPEIEQPAAFADHLLGFLAR